MKQLLIVARNHMDPTWRRCFVRQYPYRGDVIRPYSDIEETLISQYLRFIDQYHWKYSIEQSLVVEKFLERNPDEKEHLSALIREGKLELLGGGQTVIDYNLSCGESAYRNHYYSIKYYQKTFGVRPRYADLPDTFGLPAQLPQILRQFGYDAVTQFDRVFRQGKPLWRGLDGTQLLLWSARQKLDFYYPDCYKYPACPACHGDGCDVCFGSGVDLSYDFRHHEFPRLRDDLIYYAGPRCSTVEMLDAFAASDRQEYIMYVTSEETLLMEQYPEMLAALCAERDITPVFMTFAELLEYTSASLLEDLRRDVVCPEDVDPRAEGNPVATGCYTSRIELKRLNRLLEQLTLSTEKLAALALPAPAYPHGKFARIWKLLSFLQFHDGVTASHCDASYEELLQVCRDIRTAVGSIRKTALQALERTVTVQDKPGWQAVLAVNTTERVCEDVPFTLVLRDRTAFDGVELCDAAEIALPVHSFTSHRNALEYAAEVQTCLSLPPFGVRVIYWRPAEPKTATTIASPTIENEYYVVTPHGITDRRSHTTLIGEHAGGLALSHDWGHAWGRLDEESRFFPLPDTEVTRTQGDGYTALTFHGGYADPQKGIQSLRWTRTATLYDGVDAVFWRTELDWQGEDAHIYATFPLNFDHGSSGYYEIPYGMLERQDTIEPQKALGIEDEWPALNWFAAYDAARQLSVVIYNKGTPGCRIKDGMMQMSLLRSPTVPEFANEGARDHGHHVYEYALRINSGTPAKQHPSSFGLRYVTPIPTIAASPKAAALHDGDAIFPLSTQGSSVILTAIKRDAQGARILRLYEAYGEPTTLPLPEGMTAQEIDPLEECVLQDAAAALTFRPFEIKTVRLIDAAKTAPAALSPVLC